MANVVSFIPRLLFLMLAKVRKVHLLILMWNRSVLPVLANPDGNNPKVLHK